MNSSSVVDLFRRLSERRTRDHQRLYAVEGVRLVHAAIAAGREVQALVVSSRLLTSAAGQRAVDTLAACDMPVSEVGPEQFRQLSTARSASGIGAIVRQHWRPQRTPLGCGELWLGVRRVDAPGNLGTILRTAHAFGARGLVCFGDLVDPFDPGVVRAAMGGSFHAEYVRTTHGYFAVQQVARRGVRVLGASATGATLARDVAFDERPTLVLLGNERKGLTAEERALCSDTVRIPMRHALVDQRRRRRERPALRGRADAVRAIAARARRRLPVARA